MVRNFERNQPVLLEPTEAGGESPPFYGEGLPQFTAPTPGRFGILAVLFALVASVFWIGAWSAYLWGYLGLKGLLTLDLPQIALFAAAIVLPPLLFVAIAAAFALAHRMGRTAESLQAAGEHIFTADENVSRTAARLGRAVRHELDALNAGLDGAFGRLRALETALENQIAALDQAGARAEVRGETIAARLTQESQRLESVSDNLSDAASRATEIVADRSARLIGVIETAEDSLKAATLKLSDHLSDAALRATEIVTGREAELKGAIETAEDSLKAATLKLSGHLSDAALRATEIVTGREAELKGTIETAEDSLKSATLMLSDHLSDAASRAAEIVTGRSAQLKGTIETAEDSLKQAAESLSEHLAEAASRATETVAVRSAQLKSVIETAEGSLKMAGQSLDVQAAGFRAAAQSATEAPHAAALKLDEQARKIETVSDTALARAEFVLARQEKHRTAMADMLAKLAEDSAQFESTLSRQRAGMEAALGALGGEAQRFETVTGDAEQHLERIMANAASRASQLAATFMREAEQLKASSGAANSLLAGLIASLREAGTGAQTLIGESTAQAKHDAHALVGEAMAECERLLRAAGEMGAEAAKIRELLGKTIADVEHHLVRLPTLAQGEAQRIRHMVQTETDQMLDLSARAISTIHARNAQGQRLPPQTGPAEAADGDGLKAMARRLTQRSKRGADLRGGKAGETKGWEMKTLLAAAEHGEPGPRELGSGAAAAIGALQLALADMAVDLEGIDTNVTPGKEDWKRYLMGDRTVFARKLAGVIDERAVDRITALYRDDERFHDAADAYLVEFKSLLTRAREGDGGGLLTSSILTADTGKIYLAIAYALGRL